MPPFTLQDMEGLRSGMKEVACVDLYVMCGGGFFFLPFNFDLTSIICVCHPSFSLQGSSLLLKNKKEIKLLRVYSTKQNLGQLKSWRQYYCGMCEEQKQHFPYWK